MHASTALKFCFKTCVAMKFMDDDDDDEYVSFRCNYDGIGLQS